MYQVYFHGEPYQSEFEPDRNTQFNSEVEAQEYIEEEAWDIACWDTVDLFDVAPEDDEGIMRAEQELHSYFHQVKRLFEIKKMEGNG